MESECKAALSAQFARNFSESTIIYLPKKWLQTNLSVQISLFVAEKQELKQCKEVITLLSDAAGYLLITYYFFEQGKHKSNPQLQGNITSRPDASSHCFR